MLNDYQMIGVRSVKGFSLVELMLAMVIGLIITGGVMSLYITTRDTQRTSEDQLQMVADARFAIETIGYDIRHASSWGGTNVQLGIDCRLNYTSCYNNNEMPLATDDCMKRDYINLDLPVFGLNNTSINAIGGKDYTSTCAKNGYVANTDILQIRYADSSSVATAQLVGGTAYARTNFEGGMVFVYDGLRIPRHEFYKWESNPTNDAVTKNYPLVSNTYYVSSNTDGSDGIPSLRRVSLVNGPAFEDQVVLSGVVDLQVQYGIVDSSFNKGDDKTVVSYVSASRIKSNPEWQKVSAIKIWVLMRAERKDRDGITGGGKTLKYAGKSINSLDGGYRHFLVSSVISLRNTDRLGEQKAAGNN